MCLPTYAMRTLANAADTILDDMEFITGKRSFDWDYSENKYADYIRKIEDKWLECRNAIKDLENLYL